MYAVPGWEEAGEVRMRLRGRTSGVVSLVVVAAAEGDPFIAVEQPCPVRGGIARISTRTLI